MKYKQLEELIVELKTLSIKEKVPFWKRIAEDLSKPSRQRRVVNISKIPDVVKQGEIAVVPGKVIGNNAIKCEVAAFDFSEAAAKSNKTLSISELMKKNPKAQKCRIIG